MSGIEPRVGVGVFVLKDDGEFIMGIRKGSTGSGTIALPGGHLDFGESFEECARREVEEETDLHITNVHFLTAVNSVFEKENKHYVTIFMVAEVANTSRGKNPQLMEPDKCESWMWTKWEDMRAWAMVELGEAGDGINGFQKPQRTSPWPTNSQRKLFLPLLNLVRDRPDMNPPSLPKT